MRALRAIFLLAGMVLATVAAVYLTPKQLYTKDHKPDVSLGQLIPAKFGDWTLDPLSGQQVINPSEAAHLAVYYSDTLSRIYVNSKGDRIMFSLAYGADQGRSMQIHKPEVCYEAQGFKIVSGAKADIEVKSVVIPVMHLIARNGPRNEPITYWIRTGDNLVRGWLEQNVARVKNGLIKGYTPDGLLVRVSSVDDDERRAYMVQNLFIKDLLHSSSLRTRNMLLGETAGSISY
jgi:EpsI family protein